MSGATPDLFFPGRTRMAKKRLFCSFDFDNDRFLKEALIEQSRKPDSPFEVADHSLKEAAPEWDWERKAEAAIKRSAVVVVLLGTSTHRAPGVLKEVAMARRNEVPIFQLQPQDKSPTAVPNAGRVYNWTWPNLKKLLA